MGFGILFIGFIFSVFDTGTIYSDSIAYIFMASLCTLGWVITFFGVKKLYEYIPKLQYCRFLSLFLAAICMARTVCHILFKFVLEDSYVLTEILKSVSLLLPVAYATFMLLLLSGLYDIAQETGLGDLAKRAKFLRGAMFAFFLIDVAAALSGGVFTAVRYLTFILLTVLCSMLIFRCYMWICLESDLEMLPKEKKSIFGRAEDDEEVSRLLKEKKNKKK